MANRQQLRLIGAARAGDPAAQLALGRHYLFGGDGLPKNVATALLWLDRAARQHIDDAWVLIGKHIPFDIAERAGNMQQLAVWYEKAFDAGVMQAGLAFAQIVQALDSSAITSAVRDKAMHALHATAQAGIAEAQWMLAQRPEHGTRETHAAAAQPAKGKDAASMEWASSAADAGIVAARYALAERAWAVSDYKAFLHWSLPLAHDLARRSAAASN